MEDKELRNQIYGLSYRVATYPNDFDITFNEKGVEDLLQLIASYTAKEVVAELHDIILKYQRLEAQGKQPIPMLMIANKINELALKDKAPGGSDE